MTIAELIEALQPFQGDQVVYVLVCSRGDDLDTLYVPTRVARAAYGTEVHIVAD